MNSLLLGLAGLGIITLLCILSDIVHNFWMRWYWERAYWETSQDKRRCCGRCEKLYVYRHLPCGSLQAVELRHLKVDFNHATPQAYVFCLRCQGVFLENEFEWFDMQKNPGIFA